MLVQPLEIRIDRTLGSDPGRLAVVYLSGDQVSPASLPILALGCCSGCRYEPPRPCH